MSISERIRLLAESAGSQVKFAEKTGILPPTISRIIRQDGNVRSDNLALIARAYPDLNLRWLLIGEGPMWLEEPYAEEPLLLDEEKEALKDQIISLQQQQIAHLQRDIRRSCPELAKELGLE